MCVSVARVKLSLLTWLSSTNMRSGTVSGLDNDTLEETTGSRNETVSTSTDAKNRSSTLSQNCHGDILPTSIIFILDPWISQNDP